MALPAGIIGVLDREVVERRGETGCKSRVGSSQFGVENAKRPAIKGDVMNTDGQVEIEIGGDYNSGADQEAFSEREGAARVLSNKFEAQGSAVRLVDSSEIDEREMDKRRM